MKHPLSGQAIPATFSFPEITDQDSVPRRFRQVAALLPDHPAVGDEAGVITFGELDRVSDGIARFLQDRLGFAAEPVLLYLPNTRDAAAAMMGVLKAGKFYTTVDPAVGTSALSHIWRDSRARMVLTTTELEAQARALVGDDAAIASLDNLPALAGEIMIDLGSRSLAAIYYTSGSTGQPKGVLADHAMLLYRGWQFCQEEGMGPTDRVLNLFSNAFALSATIFWGALLNGATVYLRTPGEGQLSRVFDWLWEYAITVAYLTPALARSLADAPQRQRAPESVRWIALGGQSVSPKEAALVRAQFPASAVLLNRLGSSEAALIARHVIQVAGLQDHAGPLPVGQGAASIELTIVNETGMALPPGSTGQIAVRSRYLSPGYWRDPELTAAKFLPDPDGGDRRIFLTGDRGRMDVDGLLYHLGRMDLMVKVRGYRVEPESIERALLVHQNLRECVVVARPTRSGDNQLVAYLVAREQPTPTVVELRDLLAETLPSYMIPSRYVFLNALPRNANTKVDRSALPPPGHARPDLDTSFVAPRSELEQHIADIWADLLELDEVGVEDDFFELGGDSLTTMRMALAVTEATGRSVPTDFFRKPTITHLVRLLVGDSAPIPAQQPDVARATAAPSPGGQRAHSWRRRVRSLPQRARVRVRTTIEAQAFRLPYFAGVQWLLRWCGLPWVQRLYYRGESQLVRRFAQNMGTPIEMVEQQVALSLAGHAILARWAIEASHRAQPGRRQSPLIAELVAALASAPESSLWRQYLDTEGVEYLNAAIDKGRGAISVTVHTPTRYAVLSYFAQFRVPSIGVGNRTYEAAARRLERPGDGDSGKQRWWTSARAVVASEAYEVLTRGGVIRIAGDEQNAANGVTAVISDRRHRLSPGFAELAVATNATVLPMYSALLIDGRVRLTFAPPLTWERSRSRSEQVTAIVQAYASVQTEIWRQTPSVVGRAIMAQHLALPSAERSDGDPAAF